MHAIHEDIVWAYQELLNHEIKTLNLEPFTIEEAGKIVDKSLIDEMLKNKLLISYGGNRYRTIHGDLIWRLLHFTIN